MKIQSTTLLLALPALSAAFPGFLGASKDELLEEVKKRAIEENEKRALATSLTGLLSQLTTDIAGVITGLTGSVAASVTADNLRPQPGYVFQAPAATDSRGPCPGLNLLANYGYLPRNGYVTFDQVLTATSVGFNMDVDLSTLLAVFAVLGDGDIITESFYLGSGPGTVGGLNRHSTVEADISPNREDFYTGCGDNHHLSSRLFKQNIQSVLGTSTCSAHPSAANCQFTMAAMTAQYDKTATFSKTYNPYLYYFPFPSIVSLGAFPFYPNFFSNGTYGAGGVANYESISSIIGAQYDVKTGQFEYVPEKWPANWYRRATPYGAVQTLTDAIALYLTNPVGMPFGQLGTANLNPTTVLCDIYQGFQSITPLALSGTESQVEAAVTWALAKLDPYFSNTVLGCPAGATSLNMYPNSTGGPYQTPSHTVANSGNNTYNKVYFETAPTSPQCAHTFNA